MEGKQIVSPENVDVMLMRMSHQVNEQFFGFDELVIIGIQKEGFYVASQLDAWLKKENYLKTSLFSLTMEKHQATLPVMSFSPELPDLNGKAVLLVDDVLNSGQTLAYAMQPLLRYSIPRLLVAVLVERLYRKFPISASITGLQLSTTIAENVVVQLSGPEPRGVFLF